MTSSCAAATFGLLLLLLTAFFFSEGALNDKRLEFERWQLMLLALGSSISP